MMSVPLSRKRRWVAAAAAGVGVAATLALAQWQLSRAHQREAIEAGIAQQAQRPPLSARDLLAALTGRTADADLLHRPVRLTGTWDASRTVLLANRPMHGRPGFYVLSPLALQDSGQAVLVQRGWVPRDRVDPMRSAPFQTPPGTVEVTGRLALGPSRMMELKPAAEPAPGQPGAIRQNLDLQDHARETGLALLPLTVVQTSVVAPAPSDGLLRDWPQLASGARKNYGYAVQWLALSILIAGLYVWFQFGKPYVAKRSS